MKDPMGLPAWDDEGLLPSGAHAAELPDVYDRCVLDAPCREHREMLFGALTTYLRLLKTIIPAGRAWIDGSFCTRVPHPPADIDMAIHPADWTALQDISQEAKGRLYALLTLQDVAVMQPAIYLSRLQPVGGMVDAFLCHPGAEGYWHGLWSRVRKPNGSVVAGQEKGYVEVAW